MLHTHTSREAHKQNSSGDGFAKSSTVTRHAHRCVWWLHSCGRDHSKRILRTAYYRHGACVISVHVLGRILEFSCHRGTMRQKPEHQTTPYNTRTQTHNQTDEQRQASAVFPPQRGRCLRGRITANNDYSARSRCSGVGVLLSELFKSSNQCCKGGEPRQRRHGTTGWGKVCATTKSSRNGQLKHHRGAASALST